MPLFLRQPGLAQVVEIDAVQRLLHWQASLRRNRMTGFLLPIGNNGPRLVETPEVRIERNRHVRRSHFVALDGLKRFVISASEIEVPGEIRLEIPRKGCVMCLAERLGPPFDRPVKPSVRGKKSR